MIIDPIKWAMAEHICNQVAEGLTLHQISRELGCSPATVLNRATFCPEACERYARARDVASDLFESEILEEARGKSPDRTRIDTLKWAAAHRRPKVYSERIEVEHKGDLPSVTVQALPAEVQEAIKAAILKDI